MNIGPNNPSGSSGGKGRRRRGRRGAPGRPGHSGPGGRNSRNQQNQIFTRPMDHSYRNGQQDFNNNGRSRGRGPAVAAPYVHAEIEPVIHKDENAAPRIFVLIDDLFFLAKIQEVARKLNVKVEFVKSDKDIFDRVHSNGDEKPSLIIIDLNNLNAKPLSIIPKLKKELKKGTAIIGFVSHVQGELKLKAQEAGCDMVLPRSAFSQNLPSLLRRHGTAAEAD